ncbi:MAG: phage holin family protein [Candidatus Yanofskybacteria bacterium]|nr:phage holin family protein [Candidatus Yanofskybacteria bacterium]
MMSFLLRILGNAVAIYAAVWFVPGFSFTGGIKEYAIAGVVLSLLNMVLRPILKLISMPFIILTLGLFTIVINALLLWLVDYIFDFVTISDIMALVWATIVIGIVNMIVSVVVKTVD